MHLSLMKMPPNHQIMLNTLPMEPVSRTYQYRKIMKPMLERKRRARINKCLDELKDLMTCTFQADGENISKLEKADILELTVRHLQRLRECNLLNLQQQQQLGQQHDATRCFHIDKYWSGFQHCAVEVTQFLKRCGDRTDIEGDLFKHITSYLPNVSTTATGTATASRTETSATKNIMAATAYDFQRYQITKATATQTSTHNGRICMSSDEETQLQQLQLKSKQHNQQQCIATAKRTTIYNLQQQSVAMKALELNDIDGVGGVWRPW